MTTRAEEIAAEEYPDDAFRKADRATKDFPAGPYPGHETELRRAAFIKGYKRGQRDKWISVDTPPTDWAERPRKFLLLTLMPMALRMTDNDDDAFDTLQGWWRGKGWILEANPTPGMEPRIVGWMELPPFVPPAPPSPPNPEQP